MYNFSYTDLSCTITKNVNAFIRFAAKERKYLSYK